MRSLPQFKNKANMAVIASESETHGLVNDHHMMGASPEAEILLRKLAVDGRITVAEAKIQQGVHGKVLKITTEDGANYELDFQSHTAHLGGNTMNTATAMKVALDAIGGHTPRLENLYYTHVSNQQVRESLEGIFSSGGVLKHASGPESVVRKGFYFPKSDNKSDGWYVSQTPRYRYRDTAIAGIGTDFHLSSLHPESTLMEKLIERKKQSPRTQITMAPGKQQLAEGINPDFAEIVTLQAMNAREAMKILGDDAPDNLEGEELVREIATRLANRGPENILITNGGLPVVHYDRARDSHTTAEPPSVETMQKLVFDLRGERLPNEDVSRIGCGDTLLGVFMGMEKMRGNRGGDKFMTREQALEFAVIVSRYHAWNWRPNIAGIDPEFLRKLARHIAPHHWE